MAALKTAVSVSHRGMVRFMKMRQVDGLNSRLHPKIAGDCHLFESCTPYIKSLRGGAIFLQGEEAINADIGHTQEPGFG